MLPISCHKQLWPLFLSVKEKKDYSCFIQEVSRNSLKIHKRLPLGRDSCRYASITLYIVQPSVRRGVLNIRKSFISHTVWPMIPTSVPQSKHKCELWGQNQGIQRDWRGTGILFSHFVAAGYLHSYSYRWVSKVKKLAAEQGFQFVHIQKSYNFYKYLRYEKIVCGKGKLRLK